MRINSMLTRIAIVFLICAIVVSILLPLFQVSLNGYSFACIVFLSVFLISEYLEYRKRKALRDENEALGLFLSEVRHRYYIHGMADEAVFDAEESICDCKFREKITRLADVLRSEDASTEAVCYRQMEKNRYLKLFLTLSLTVMEYGDRKNNNQSLYLSNLMNIKGEMRKEIIADRELQGRTSGMTVVAAAPAFFLKLIEGWGIENLPELESFYQSTFGKTLAAALFLCSVLTYLLINILRARSELNEALHIVLRKIEAVPFIRRALRYLEAEFPKHHKKALIQLNEAGESMTSRQLLLQKILFSGTVLFFFIMAGINQALHEEEGIHFLFIVFCILFSFYIPDMLLCLKRSMVKLHMEEEVMQYHSIIMMLMYIEKVAVYEILEVIEQFSLIFRRTISDCLNDFPSGETEALEEMRHKEGCAAFRRLTEQFLMCDRIGVRQAFDEIQADREYYQKKQEAETAMIIHKKILLGQFIAFLPLILCVGLYLIVPFAKESLEMLQVFYAEGSF